MKKKLLILLFVLVILGAGFYLFKNRSIVAPIVPAQKTQVMVNPTQATPVDKEVLVENLEIPWEIVFLPTGEMLLTERPGRLLKIGTDRKVIEVKGVRHVGEGGLLGMVLHPKFEQNNFIYLYLTTEENNKLSNRVERYKLQNDVLVDREVIIDGIEGASNHDGGRMAFGPDGFLYVATGDAQNPQSAQNGNSLNGKILKVTADGGIPKDNPFGNEVYSYGHRNVQGMTWDAGGNLWATEHGQSGFDELNLIEKGKNYGWPEIEGDVQKGGMVAPVINSGANETWAPSGASYFGGSVFFSGLRGETLYEAKITNRKVTELKKHLQNQYGRLRTVKVGPEDLLYILTNNQDGRGIPTAGDDKLIRIDPKSLQ